MPFLQITEHGEVRMNETPVSDEMGAAILESLKVAENGSIQTLVPDGSGTTLYTVEAVDEPIVALECFLSDDGSIQLSAPYETSFNGKLESLSVDEWDRFHGLTDSGVPFILSAEAQEELFDSVDSFDDDSITAFGKKIPVPPWLSSSAKVSTSELWTSFYKEGNSGWELERPSPVLEHRLDSLKLPKSRVLVLGCGSGEDAALFARHGHLVTALDFSPEAIARAKNKHGGLENIQWIEGDAFQLQEKWLQSFDIIFEHTLYCAIQPERRNELVAIWRKYLVPGGFLIGVFFTMEKRQGPPFGGSEKEIQLRLKKHFQTLQWKRSHHSIPARMGKELFVVAQKPFG